MSYIIEVKTKTGYNYEFIHYIKIARLGRFVCGTYDLILTDLIEKARKFKTKEEAQNFIDKTKGKIETYETMKKKIKDLRKKDFKNTCKKHSNCYWCPLSITFDCGEHIYCVNDILEREVEIDE